jgi:hypothetical protein
MGVEEWRYVEGKVGECTWWGTINGNSLPGYTIVEFVTVYV